MFPLYLKIFVYFNLLSIVSVCLFILLSKQKGTNMPEDFKKILMAKFKNDRQEKIDFWINSKIGVNQVKKLIGRLDEKYKEHGIDV